MATGRPHSLRSWGMARLFFALILIFTPQVAFGFGAISCGSPIGNETQCFATFNYSSQPLASTDALVACAKHFKSTDACYVNPTRQFSNTCQVVTIATSGLSIHIAPTAIIARKLGLDDCARADRLNCRVALIACDGTASDSNVANALVTSLSPSNQSSTIIYGISNWNALRPRRITSHAAQHSALLRQRSPRMPNDRNRFRRKISDLAGVG